MTKNPNLFSERKFETIFHIPHQTSESVHFGGIDQEKHVDKVSKTIIQLKGDNMPRRYAKNEFVNILSEINGKFLGIAKVLDWTYYPENKTYDYLVKNINTGIEGTFEEGHLIHLKIKLTQENPKKMNAFYEALTNSKLSVIFDHNVKKKTYTIVGHDLDKAKDLFQKIARNKKFLCPDCGHIHGNER